MLTRVSFLPVGKIVCGEDSSQQLEDPVATSPYQFPTQASRDPRDGNSSQKASPTLVTTVGASKCTLLIMVGYIDDVVTPVRRSMPSDPICKRLVSSRPEEQDWLIKDMLGDRGEHRAAKDLELGDALKLVEFFEI